MAKLPIEFAEMLTSDVEGGLEELQRLGVEFAVGGCCHDLVGAVLSLPDVREEPAVRGKSIISVRWNKTISRAGLTQTIISKHGMVR